MKLQGSVVLVTGANRGLGKHFASQALARGAAKVYAGTRDLSKIDIPGVVPVKLDVTNGDDVAAVAERCKDVTLLINNAGIARVGGFIEGQPAALLRELLETNLFGMLNMSQAFAGTLGRNGGGAILNVLSIGSWVSSPALASYGVTKAAAWSLTNGLRHQLRPQGTQVLALHAGFIDTDLTRGIDLPKARPEDVVDQAFTALEAGESEVLTDERTRAVKQAFPQGVYLREL